MGEPAAATAAAAARFDEVGVERLAARVDLDGGPSPAGGGDPAGGSDVLSAFHGGGTGRRRGGGGGGGSGRPRGGGGGGSGGYHGMAHEGGVAGGGAFASGGCVEMPLALSLDGGPGKEKEGRHGPSAALAVGGARVDLSWRVPPKRGARWSASFAGSSASRHGLGYLSCTSRVGYDLLPSTRLYADMELGPRPRNRIGASILGGGRRRPTCVSVALASSGGGGRTAAAALSMSARRRLLGGRVLGTVALNADRSASGGAAPRLRGVRLALTTLTDQIPAVSLGLNLGLSEEGGRAAPLQLAVEGGRGTVAVGAPVAAGGAHHLRIDALLRRVLPGGTAALSVGIRAGPAAGLAWLWQLDQGNFRLRVPVTVRPGIDGAASAVAAVYLAVLSALIDTAVADMIGAARSRALAVDGDGGGASAGSAMKRTASLLRIDKAREDAEVQLSLMGRQAETKLRREESKNGLVIDTAVYYVEGGDRLDVATQLQFWVNDSSLYLPSTPKSNLLGFYDVTGGSKMSPSKKMEEKGAGWREPWKRFWAEPDVLAPILYVCYRFEGEYFEVSVRDDDELVLPSPSATRLDKELKQNIS